MNTPTEQQIHEYVQRLVNQANLLDIFPDLYQQPLHWQVAAIGIIATIAGERAVAQDLNTALKVMNNDNHY